MQQLFAFPSAVTAAKTVDEYGAQATSPTALPRSNVNIGSLQTDIMILIITRYIKEVFHYPQSAIQFLAEKRTNCR